MLSPEFESFCRSWLTKAEAYPTDDVRQCFDKYFTLYVVFNRLYAEATFTLGRRREDVRRNLERATAFPDTKAATTYLIEYVGPRKFVAALAADVSTSAALDFLKEHLRTHRFYLLLGRVRGERRPKADTELLARLESRSSLIKGTALLEAIYAVRCNMFHGHKGYDEVQVELLVPMIAILTRVIEVTQRKLEMER